MPNIHAPSEVRTGAAAPPGTLPMPPDGASVPALGPLRACDLAPREVAVLPPCLSAAEALQALESRAADIALVGPPTCRDSRIATADALARAVQACPAGARTPLHELAVEVPCAAEDSPLHELNALMEDRKVPCVLLCAGSCGACRIITRQEITDALGELHAASDRAVAWLSAFSPERP